VTEDSGRTSGNGAGATDQPPERRRRLDPDRATAARRAARHAPPPVIDTRRYQRMIGFFGLTLAAIVAVAFLLSGHSGTVGIPAGQQVPEFAAPLAVSNLNLAANLHPHCTIAQHDPRALNVCLMVKRAPLVLAFFVTTSGACEREVTALQQVSHQLPAGAVQFAAVAVSSDHQDAARAVRAHDWTIPVGYDVDGRVGAAFGVEVCPVVELVRRGGIVAKLLVGEHWNTSAALAPQVRTLVSNPGR
jgi:peroxiredoxin